MRDKMAYEVGKKVAEGEKEKHSVESLVEEIDAYLAEQERESFASAGGVRRVDSRGTMFLDMSEEGEWVISWRNQTAVPREGVRPGKEYGEGRVRGKDAERGVSVKDASRSQSRSQPQSQSRHPRPQAEQPYKQTPATQPRNPRSSGLSEEYYYTPLTNTNADFAHPRPMRRFESPAHPAHPAPTGNQNPLPRKTIPRKPHPQQRRPRKQSGFLDAIKHAVKKVFGGSRRRTRHVSAWEAVAAG
ncbi:hypothetical protein BU23DRAFT_650934 [Bimuria novae-zelandiae CBS 107.79]|uniref:Uncharacterized protein n=1 Tax=Bimuria novae-zelandiae CBS 107.79 TaxID=1447943 RepID=A0A6A5V1G0_9PLEO|nr:hypothetical protein BU23DRAFT_650934 [Bimuria novae-zelandiae CBS 107.79]